MGRARLFDTKQRKRKQLDTSGNSLNLFEGASNRFTKRYLAPMPKFSADFRADAMRQVSVGWLEGPSPLTKEGRHVESPDLSINLRFRLNARQIDKVGACGDFTKEQVNRLRHTASPTPFL